MRMCLWFTKDIFFYKTEGPEGGSDCVLYRTQLASVRTKPTLMCEAATGAPFSVWFVFFGGEDECEFF